MLLLMLTTSKLNLNPQTTSLPTTQLISITEISIIHYHQNGVLGSVGSEPDIQTPTNTTNLDHVTLDATDTQTQSEPSDHLLTNLTTDISSPS